MGNFCDKEALMISFINDDDDIITAKNIMKQIYYVHLLGEKNLLINAIKKKIELCIEYEKLICRLNTYHNKIICKQTPTVLIYKTSIIERILEIKKKAIEDEIYIDNLETMYTLNDLDNIV